MKKFIASLVLGMALASASASAQDLTAPDDQIIVTGARAPVLPGNVGSAITVLSSDDIERHQSRYVSDLLRTIPGFAVSHSGVAGSQTQVRVRGSEANHVLVLIDGIQANDPATGDEFRWEYLTTNNIERIEVVRGPQSSLWGSGALGAVVHIITRSGSDRQSVGGYVEGGTDSALNGALRGAAGGERFKISYGIEQLSTDGTNISRSGDEDDDSEITSANISGQFAANDAILFKFGVRSIDAYSQFDAVDFFVTGLPADSDSATDTRQNYAQLGATLGASDAGTKHHLNVRYFDSENQNLVDGSDDSSTSSERLTIGYQSDIRLGRQLLSLAVERESTKFEQRGAIVFGDPNQDQEIDVTSAIVDFQGRATERLSWLLSARLDNNSDFDNSLTGRLSATYRVTESTVLRANVGTAQKNPTFTERFGFFPGQFIGNPDLKPELSTSYDLGLGQQLLAGKLDLQVSVFRQDLEDEINGFVFDPVTFSSTAENMTGSSKRRGAEIAAQWNISESLGLGSTYTYTDATEQDAGGNRIDELRRPRHVGSVYADMRFAQDRGRLAFTADYGGTRDDIFFPPFPEPSEIVTLSNYWLLGLTAQYQLNDTVKLFARGTNLLDTQCEQVYGYQTAGRKLYAGVQMTFGN
ncbi:MAG: TonB-dependent receptor [Gammaproteobacteria bacterium]|nr:TonB-dependent receptor [Gammaproteobacteria bacterium]